MSRAQEPHSTLFAGPALAQAPGECLDEKGFTIPCPPDTEFSPARPWSNGHPSSDLPQTPVAAAAVVFTFMVPGNFPPGLTVISVIDDDKAHLSGHQVAWEADVIRESDCVYQLREATAGTVRAQIDFSKLVHYQTRPAGMTDVYFRISGAQNLWCDNFGLYGRGPLRCWDRMENRVWTEQVSRLLRALQFIADVCPSQVPF